MLMDQVTKALPPSICMFRKHIADIGLMEHLSINATISLKRISALHALRYIGRCTVARVS